MEFLKHFLIYILVLLIVPINTPCVHTSVRLMRNRKYNKLTYLCLPISASRREQTSRWTQRNRDHRIQMPSKQTLRYSRSIPNYHSKVLRSRHNPLPVRRDKHRKDKVLHIISASRTSHLKNPYLMPRQAHLALCLARNA